LEGKNFVKRRIEGPLADALKVADEIAVELLDTASRQILEKLKR
jgi:hypothetical protein